MTTRSTKRDPAKSRVKRKMENEEGNEIKKNHLFVQRLRYLLFLAIGLYPKLQKNRTPFVTTIIMRQKFRLKGSCRQKRLNKIFLSAKKAIIVSKIFSNALYGKNSK